ncbi:MAG: hypothetical protein RBU21_18065 [FCB group bacterium]|nr:hypothetical protein [FCB group bacterium]
MRYLLVLRAAVATRDLPRGIRVCAVYGASIIDLVIWTPIFTGAAVLWGYVALTKYENPLLLWLIVPIWSAAAIPPARWALRAAQNNASQ